MPLADAMKASWPAGVTFIDIRDPRELWRDGTIPGAINVTRGMLEMWIDPESPDAKDYFQTGNKFVLLLRRRLAVRRLPPSGADMGLTPVAHIDAASAPGRRPRGRSRRSSQRSRAEMSPDTALVPQPTVETFRSSSLDSDTASRTNARAWPDKVAAMCEGRTRTCTTSTDA